MSGVINKRRTVFVAITFTEIPSEVEMFGPDIPKAVDARGFYNAAGISDALRDAFRPPNLLGISDVDVLWLQDGDVRPCGTSS